MRESNSDGHCQANAEQLLQLGRLQNANAPGIRQPFRFDIPPTRQERLDQKPELREVPFESERMMMATYHRVPHGIEVAVKGAPRRVLEVCTTIAGADGNGDESSMDATTRRKWGQRAG